MKENDINAHRDRKSGSKQQKCAILCLATNIVGMRFNHLSDTFLSLDASNDRVTSHRRGLQNAYPRHRATFGIIDTLFKCG